MRPGDDPGRPPTKEAPHKVNSDGDSANVATATPGRSRVRCLLLSACIDVDLRQYGGVAHDDDRRDRRKLYDAELDTAPDGTRVVLLVGDRSYISDSLAAELHGHARRLQLDVHGDNTSVIAIWHATILRGTTLEVTA